MSPSGAHVWVPYCGHAPVPGEWLTRWNLDPFLLAAIAVLAVIAWRTAQHSPRSRKIRLGATCALAIILFVSPFCALTSALFSARVVHHVALTAILAPLLISAIPRGSKAIPGNLTFWTAAQAMIFWLWHAPAIYSAALSSHPLYWLMQLSLLGSSLAFWAALQRSSPAAAVGALLVTMVQMGLLGALIALAGAPLYAPHFLSTEAWGFSPLEDQQMAGLIMWAPAAGLYLIAALAVAGRWLGAESRLAAR